MSRKRQVKLVGLIFFTAIISTFLLTDMLARTARGFSSGPPPERTGAPGERTCNSCHSGPEGFGLFTITAPSGYVPGQTYPITVTHSTEDKSRMKWGFQLTCLTNSNDERAGDLHVTEITNVLFGEKDFLERQYIEHNAGGTFEGQFFGASWTFDWTAPATDVGPLTFYAAGNQADGGFTNAEDQIYTTERAMPLACVTLSSSVQSFGARGGSGIANVSATLGCSWNVLNGVDWIILTSPDEAAGSGEITYEVRENLTGSGRIGSIIVGGRILTVVQDGGQTNCAYSISPKFNNFSAAGGANNINVTATAGCVWQAVPSASWITITSASAGIGNATLSYTVAANPGPSARKGTIKIAGQTFSIKQQ